MLATLYYVYFKFYATCISFCRANLPTCVEFNVNFFSQKILTTPAVYDELNMTLYANFMQVSGIMT